MWQKRNKKSVFFFKGSVTVFALLLMFILAVTTIGIISTAAIERRVSISTGNSTTAFQIAESGMEKTLQYFKSNFDKTLNDINGSVNCLAGGIVRYDSKNMNTIRFINNADPPAYITNCGSPISSVKIIKSIGTTKQETRAIEEDVFFGATKLLLHLNGKNDSDKFEDSSFYWNNHAVTTTGSVSVESDNNSLIKLGEGSAKFDGTGYLSVQDSKDWNLGDGDFTIDLWVRFLSTAGMQTLLERENSNLRFYYFNNYFYFGTESKFSWIPLTDTWNHIALVRRGGTLSMYVGGLSKGTSLNSDNIISPSSPPLYIGAKYDGTQFFNGYIDEIRISKGIARWTSNFIPPTAEYWPD